MGRITEKDNYKDGKLNGDKIEYWQSGRIYRKTNYKDDVQQGAPITYYDEDGEKIDNR